MANGFCGPAKTCFEACVVNRLLFTVQRQFSFSSISVSSVDFDGFKFLPSMTHWIQFYARTCICLIIANSYCRVRLFRADWSGWDSST